MKAHLVALHADMVLLSLGRISIEAFVARWAPIIREMAEALDTDRRGRDWIGTDSRGEA